LRQLQSYGIDSPAVYSEGAIDQIFAQTTVNVSRLVGNHKWLAAQYSVYCSQLMKDLANESTPTQELIKSINAALIVAGLLDRIYSSYLNEVDQMARMHRDQVEYRKMLQEREVDILLLPTTRDTSYSKEIHENIAAANRLRLFTIRVRRLIIVTTPVLKNYEQYGLWVGMMERWTSPAVAYLAWLTLLPRLLKNVFILFKHLTPITLWMSKEEISLGAGTRLSSHLELHWFELANDLVTVTVGLLNCFALTGGASLYLGVSLLAFDVVLATVRACYELHQLQKIKKIYAEMENPDENYLSYLEKRIYYDGLRYKMAVINTVLLLFSASLSIPFIAFNPIIPLIGASLAVLTTIGNLIACQQIERYKPDDKIVYTPREESTPHQESTSRQLSNLTSLSIFPPAVDGLPREGELIVEGESIVSRGSSDATSESSMPEELDLLSRRGSMELSA
jgi:hypothetical protein